VSDVQLVRTNRFISHQYHQPGDQLLADRGFLLKDDFAMNCSTELLMPAFTKGKSQLSPEEVEVSRKISCSDTYRKGNWTTTKSVQNTERNSIITNSEKFIRRSRKSNSF